jgi:mutator protein MutT
VPLEPLLAAVAARGAGAPPEHVLEAPRLSAVLVALFDGERGAEVVLTRRAEHLTTHKGEVSFPGGRADPGETPEAAALREAHEEVALDPASVEVVGELDHIATWVSASVIVPVVGRLAARPDLRPGTDEVDRILYLPLAELLRADTYHEEVWDNDERWTAPIAERSLHFFTLDDETVWGATARVLVQLLSLATGMAR